MPGFCRRPLAGLLTAMLAVACAPGPVAVITQPGPTGVVIPAAAPAGLPLPGAVIPPVQPQLDAHVIFPAGTLPLLTASLHTQAAIDPKELSVKDLQRLEITLGGQPVAGTQVSFSNLQWDSTGRISFSLVVTGIPFTAGQDIRVNLPANRLTLIGTAGGSAITIEISVQTTARSLLTAAIDGAGDKGKKAGAVPSAEAIELVAARLVAAMTGAGAATNPLANPALIRIVAVLASAINQGVAPAQQVDQINSGGSSGGSGVIAPVLAVTALTPVTGPRHTATVITITGTAFVTGATVLIGVTAATGVNVVSGTQITATVPAGIPAGVHGVRVTNPDTVTTTLAAAYTATVPNPSLGGSLTITPGTDPVTLGSI